MPRGLASEVGSTMVNKNGYHCTKTEAGWRFTHHIIAEEKLGRRLRYDEMARFIDHDRKNLDPDNIEVVIRQASLRGRIQKITKQIDELQTERAKLSALLERAYRDS